MVRRITGLLITPPPLVWRKTNPASLYTPADRLQESAQSHCHCAKLKNIRAFCLSQPDQRVVCRRRYDLNFTRSPSLSGECFQSRTGALCLSSSSATAPESYHFHECL